MVGRYGMENKKFNFGLDRLTAEEVKNLLARFKFSSIKLNNCGNSVLTVI